MVQHYRCTPYNVACEVPRDFVNGLLAADAAQAPSTRPSLRDAALAVGGDSIEQADSARRQDGRFRLTSAQKLRVPTNQTKVHSKA